MKTNTTIGAIFLGAGFGILLGLLLPSLAWFWPLGLILGGVLLWRRLGTLAATIVVAASLSLALSSGPLNLGFPAFGERQLARYEITGDEARAWREVRRLVVLNAVGDVSVGVGDDPSVTVRYRGGRGAARPPASLQASYDPASGTLRVVGTDPHGAKDERRGLSAEIEVVLPMGVAVEAGTGIGDVRVQGAAEAAATSGVGDVTVLGASGAVSARSGVGNVELTFERPLAGSVSASTDVGDVRLTLPAASSASVRAISGMRSFGGALERVTGDESRLSLGVGEQQVELRTRIGKVEVRTR